MIKQVVTTRLSKNESKRCPELKISKRCLELYQVGDNIAKLEIGIAGVFSVEENRFEKATEENLVKNQIPSLLFPYIRSAITSVFAHAGLGSILLPLINVQELAKSAKLSITEIE